MIDSPIGQIHMRRPTETEAIQFEDKHRSARRKRDDTEIVDGSLYNNGLEEILACVTSHKVEEMHPADDGLLADVPALFDRLVSEFRSVGGAGLDAKSCPEAVTEDFARGFGKKAVGFLYGGVQIACRKLTWPEYTAFSAERDDTNWLAVLAKYTKRCILSPVGTDLESLAGRFPYLTVAIGLKLYDLAEGVVENKQKKSVSVSQTKSETCTSQQPAFLQPDMASGGGGS